MDIRSNFGFSTHSHSVLLPSLFIWTSIRFFFLFLPDSKNKRKCYILCFTHEHVKLILLLTRNPHSWNTVDVMSACVCVCVSELLILPFAIRTQLDFIAECCFSYIHVYYFCAFIAFNIHIPGMCWYFDRLYASLPIHNVQSNKVRFKCEWHHSTCHETTFRLTTNRHRIFAIATPKFPEYNQLNGFRHVSIDFFIDIIDIHIYFICETLFRSTHEFKAFDRWKTFQARNHHSKKKSMNTKKSWENSKFLDWMHFCLALFWVFFDFLSGQLSVMNEVKCLFLFSSSIIKVFDWNQLLCHLFQIPIQFDVMKY